MAERLIQAIESCMHAHTSCNVYTLGWYLSYIFEMAWSNLYPAWFLPEDNGLCGQKKLLNKPRRLPLPLSPSSTDTQKHKHCRQTHTPLSTLPQAVVLIPPRLFSVTHGRGGSQQWSLTARLTFALSTDLFFRGTGSRTGAVAGR